MKFFYILLINFVCHYSLSAQSVDWVFAVGDHTDDAVYATATDDFGNTYVSGQLGSGVTIGDTTLSTWGYFLAKLDSNGQYLWVRHDDNYEIYTQDILIDSNGDVIVTGTFDSYMNQYNIILQGSSNENTFIFKYDSSGNVLWGKGFSTINDGQRMANFASTLDNNDNIYLTGHFNHDANVGGTLISPTTPSKRDIYLIRLDSNGNVNWVRTGGGRRGEEIEDQRFSV